MSPISVTCFKGVGDSRVVPFEATQPLASVRQQLTSAGFLAPDAADVAYRFVALQSESSNLFDSVIQPAAENIVPLAGVMRNNILYVTNVRAPRRPDLVGETVQNFVHGHLNVNVWLNNNDATTRAANAAVSSTQLMMLKNVRPTNAGVTGYFENVVACVEGSVVGFNLTSWGAAGFQFFIGPDAGEAVVNGDLNICFWDSPNRYGTGSIQRYANRPASIQIRGTAALGISGGETLRYQKVVFKSRNIRSYAQDGRVYRSDQRPPTRFTTLDVGTLPGGSITPGTVSPGPTSAQQFGKPIYDIQCDDWSQPLGEVVVYFFVFPDWRIANTVIQTINSGGPRTEFI